MNYKIKCLLRKLDYMFNKGKYYKKMWQNGRNLIEHGYNVKVEHICENTYDHIYYGFLDSIVLRPNVHLAKSCISIKNMISVDRFDPVGALHDDPFGTLVFCTPHEKTFLTIGNKRFDMRYYTKDQIVEILTKLGVQVDTEEC